MTTEAFLKLKKVWYDKLTKSGFKDAEDFQNRLSTYTSQTTVNKALERLPYNQVKAEYYRKAGHFLHDYKFDSVLHKKIWELHATGVSYRAIVKKLSAKYPVLTKYKINLIINDLQQDMKKFYEGAKNE